MLSPDPIRNYGDRPTKPSELLLKILVLGENQIAEGKVVSADHAIRRIRERREIATSKPQS